MPSSSCFHITRHASCLFSHYKVPLWVTFTCLYCYFFYSLHWCSLLLFLSKRQEEHCHMCFPLVDSFAMLSTHSVKLLCCRSEQASERSQSNDPLNRDSNKTHRLFFLFGLLSTRVLLDISDDDSSFLRIHFPTLIHFVIKKSLGQQ